MLGPLPDLGMPMTLKLKLNYAVAALKGIKRYRKYPQMVAAETLKIISEIGKEKDNERIFKRLGS